MTDNKKSIIQTVQGLRGVAALLIIKKVGKYGRYGIITLIIAVVILQGCIGVAGDKISEIEVIGAGHRLAWHLHMIAFTILVFLSHITYKVLVMMRNRSKVCLDGRLKK